MPAKAGIPATPYRGFGFPLRENDLAALHSLPGVTVRRQLIDANAGKRAELTVGIFLQVRLDQLGVVALADGLPKRQFNFPVVRVPHAERRLA